LLASFEACKLRPGTEEIFLSYVSYCQNWVSTNLLKLMNKIRPQTRTS
jgi:hypothetical protein